MAFALSLTATSLRKSCQLAKRREGDTRMKLLFVTSRRPSPPMNGGMRRVHSLISGLARSHAVSVLSFAEPRDYLEVGLAATREYCDEVVTVPNRLLGISSRHKRLL